VIEGPSLSTCKMSRVVPNDRHRASRAWETSLTDIITYVGLDVHKATISVALAEAGRGARSGTPSGDPDKAGGAADRGPQPKLLLQPALRLRVAPAADRSGRDWHRRVSDAAALSTHQFIKGTGLRSRNCPGASPRPTAQSRNHALLAGVHPKVVQLRLGHSSISVTLDLYSHVTETIQAEAATKLDTAFQSAITRVGAKGR
jgi:hypothetical protein